MKLLRKLFHILSGTFIILAIIFFHHNYSLYIVIGLGIISILGLLVDFLRITFQTFNELLTKKLLPIIFYKSEEKGINSATFFFFSASFSILFFDKIIAILAIAILTYADSFASIIGYKFGKIKIGEKTLEGGLVFFIITFLICLFGLSIWKALIISIILTLVEIVSLKVDDNLSIPIVAGFLFMTIGRL